MMLLMPACVLNSCGAKELQVFAWPWRRHSLRMALDNCVLFYLQGLSR